MKKYIKPNIKVKKIKLNLFFRKDRGNLNKTEGLLLAGYSCNETRLGHCAI
ncbi:MAG: hypothetical protein ACD_12C00523G0003 [uncultured bacterium]|nr:MAG: hypothetical protein ACD_12C00523G0003 [uncultured bacterium]